MAEPFIINDRNYKKVLSDIKAAGNAMGCIPRDYSAMPFGALRYAAEWNMPEMSDEEIADRIADQERNKSSLEHIRRDCGIKSLFQNGWGYCWAFSTVKAVMYVRAIQNQPTVVLSGTAVAAIIKGYKNQGGWCQQSLDFVVKHGVPSVDVWPENEVKRSLDNAAMRADAATRKVTEWLDMEPRNSRQTASNLLRNIPTMMDLNWWEHSVCGIRLVQWKPTLKIKIDNSHGVDFGEDGMATLEGRKAVPDGQACPLVSGAS